MTLMSDSLRETLGITPRDGEDVPHIDQQSDVPLEDLIEPPREPARFEVQEVDTSVPDLIQSDAKVDYVVARNHTYTILRMTSEALARALQVANETEHPRAFESFNSLAQTARLLTQDLLALQKVFKEVTKDRPELIPPTQSNVQVNGDVNIGGGQSQGTVNLMSMLSEAISKGEIRPIVKVKPNDQES